MTWFCYQLIITLSIPVVLLRLWFKNKRQPGYGQRWWQRLGFGWPDYRKYNNKPYWIHAVSLGEAMASRPIIDDWLKTEPERKILVTTTTLSGYQHIKQVYGDKVLHCFFPYDNVCIIRRIVKRVQPACVVVMETELWWAWFRVLNENNIPIILANARLSKRSLRRYARYSFFARPLFNCMSKICAQTKIDARRFSVLVNSRKIEVMGNLKFMTSVSNKGASTCSPPWNACRPIWLIASTHAPEEQLLLPIIDKLQSDIPNLLTCIAPRHPDRREEIISQLKHSNLKYSVRSRKESVETSTSVYLLDTLGELAGFYSYADVVFVGGSLIPHGGQNILEPIAMGVPVVVGPHTFNFQSIVQSLVKQHGLVQVDDVESLYDITKQLFLDNNLHKTQSKLALDYLNQHRGALLSFKHIFQSVLSAYK